MTRRPPARLATALVAALLLLGGFAASADAAQWLEGFSGSLTGEGSAPSTAAGAHPRAATNVFNFVTEPREVQPGVVENFPVASPKDLRTQQPIGLVGAPAAMPHCTNADFSIFDFNTGAESRCPNGTAIGLAEVEYPYGITNYSPIFNLVPPSGRVAEFGFKVAFQNVRLVASVSPAPSEAGGYAVGISSVAVSQGLALKRVTISLWGVPGDPVHDAERGTCVKGYGFEGSCPSGMSSPPTFLRNPTSCTGPLRTSLEGTSWQEPTTVLPREFSGAAMEGCANLPFSPTISAKPTSGSAASPTGLEVDVRMPQAGFDNPAGRSESDLRGAVVTLPEGMAINPAAANGQGACSASQIELGQPTVAPSCPDASKIGTLAIKTPLLEEPLAGSIYLAKQHDNRFDSLLAIYAVVDDPATGVVLKLPGKVEAGPSGRLTAGFTDTPQLPFEEFSLDLFGGPRAPLVNPGACGTYSAEATFSPWSGAADRAASGSFAITSGPNGGPCPSDGFSPKVTAGTVNPVAGASSPFILDVSREDGDQRLAGISATLPPGLLAKLKGVPYCPDGDLGSISSAEGTGAAQLARPSCSAASKVGTVTVGSGAGPAPFLVETGSAYLAGPYKGAPLSVAFVVPALAGPFDLGTVVVRAALAVDRRSTVVTATSDPLPSVLYGIPLDLRQVHVALDRPSFTVNPTSCDPAEITTRVSGSGGAIATQAGRFQVGGCERLAFAPKLALRYTGQTKRTGNPALSAVLKQPDGANANLSTVSVVLPKTAFLDQAHLKNTCTRPQFAAGSCPAGSVLGTARAVSPLLDAPLEGPVYLRSNGGERKLPDLVADLHGQIDVEVTGFIDSLRVKGGSRIRTRFLGLPDAPISEFSLRLLGGKRGLLQNSTGLCGPRLPANFTAGGQNGKVSTAKVKVGVKCRRGKKAGARKPGRRA